MVFYLGVGVKMKLSNLVIISIAYTAFLILSNLTASKIGQIGDLHFTGVIVFFPFTYIISDVLTEVYGFKVSRMVIWFGLLANLLVVGCALIVTYLVPPSEHWQHQESFEVVFGTSSRILLASVSGYLVGEFVNAIILAKVKIAMQGRHFWFRALFSTVVGAFADTIVFMFVAFLFVIPIEIIINMIIVEYIIKIAVEVLVLPVTYKLVNYLKRTDHVDCYDVNTRFNPFAISID
jgi:queuosine precursor transporter